ncbi:MAG TPA: VOC family protein [Bacillales bacterium]|nr:VOC family protein [Bacillales bacterium]
MQDITTFLKFNGQAEEAIRFYVSLFDDASMESLHHNEDGSVRHAVFRLKGLSFMAVDGSGEEPHPFTPAMSLFVQCRTEKEIERVFRGLADGGKVLTPLAESPFSEKYGRVEDRYGVSWQLNL